MFFDRLVKVRVKEIAIPHIAWAEGMEFSLPRSILNKKGFLVDAGGELYVDGTCFYFGEEIEDIRLIAAYTEKKPVSSRLPFSYQKVPPLMRTYVASLMGKWRRRSIDKWAIFPGWPLDLSADFLEDLAIRKPPLFASGKTPVLLTHDLDSPEGLLNLSKFFLDVEESYGARSCSYVVPGAWPLDHNLLRNVVSRGHEIGIHGFDHSNITPFLNEKEKKKRLTASLSLIEEFGIEGYRAPSLLRTKGLLQELSNYYKYDSSIPTSGGMFPVPNNGCATARPFRVEGIIEIPLSLPRDGSLRFLGYSPNDILKIWIDCSEKISLSGGLVVLLTHCEARFSGNPEMLQVYKRYLEYISSSERYKWSNHKEIIKIVEH